MEQFILPNFLSESECNALIELARPTMARSEGFNVMDGTSTVSEYRTSEQTFLYGYSNNFVSTIQKRVAFQTGFPVANQEGIQIAHYTPGSYYKEHWDYCDPNWTGVAGFLARGGNRVITFMIYLNTIPEGCGGETYFTEAGVSVKPDIGKACMWYNLFPNMAINLSTKHEGRPPVEPYEKWIATVWIRERTFT